MGKLLCIEGKITKRQMSARSGGRVASPLTLHYGDEVVGEIKTVSRFKKPLRHWILCGPSVAGGVPTCARLYSESDAAGSGDDPLRLDLFGCAPRAIRGVNATALRSGGRSPGVRHTKNDAVLGPSLRIRSRVR